MLTVVIVSWERFGVFVCGMVLNGYSEGEVVDHFVSILCRGMTIQTGVGQLIVNFRSRHTVARAKSEKPKEWVTSTTPHLVHT